MSEVMTVIIGDSFGVCSMTAGVWFCLVFGDNPLQSRYSGFASTGFDLVLIILLMSVD